MKSRQFDSTVSGANSLTIPPEIARELPSGEKVRVILLWDADEDRDWAEMSAMHFAEAYDPADSIYEQLLNDAPNR
jgi:hypothetical protein